MKKSTWIITAVVALLANASGPFLYAGPGHRGMDGLGPLARLERAQKELGLSDQQVGEIKAIFKSVHDQNAQYRDQLRGGIGGVLNALLEDPDDIAGAQAIMDRQAQTERAIRSNLLNGASKALNVLTPEQRDKLGQIVARRQQQRLQRWQF
ncbi:MAG: Spy/CpxP family protein refolding chaperone [Thermoanaerobaculia bacterium]